MSRQTLDQPPGHEVYSHLRILYAEDHEIFQEKFSDLCSLELPGSHVDMASSPQEAVEAIEGNSYTAVVTDGLNGLWVVVEEKARERNIPVLLLSADESAMKYAQRKRVPAIDKMFLVREKDRLLEFLRESGA